MNTFPQTGQLPHSKPMSSTRATIDHKESKTRTQSDLFVHARPIWLQYALDVFAASFLLSVVFTILLRLWK